MLIITELVHPICYYVGHSCYLLYPGKWQVMLFTKLLSQVLLKPKLQSSQLFDHLACPAELKYYTRFQHRSSNTEQLLWSWSAVFIPFIPILLSTVLSYKPVWVWQQFILYKAILIDVSGTYNRLIPWHLWACLIIDYLSLNLNILYSL